MSKIALIHCGCHKTGSTFFQSLLKKNSKKLHYYIPETFRLKFYPINHAPLAWKIIQDERLNNFNNELNDLKDEIKHKKKILLSSEDFSLVLSNPKTKKIFEQIFSSYKIVYLCFFRHDKTREISLLNEFRYHYKSLKKFKTISDLFFLKINGLVKHTIYKSLEVCYYYTSHKKLVRSFLKNSKGKFFILRYGYNTNIEEYLKKILIFNNFDYDSENTGIKKNRRSYNFFKSLIRSKRIFINQSRNKQTIKKLNKTL
jgi:hypothetical protein